MLLSPQHAEHIVAEMKAAIHRDINIMDESGTIIASTNPARRGKVHAGALQIIQNHLPSLTIWQDDTDAGVQQGINLPITIGGELAGVIGITGAPDEVSIFGDIIKRMTEVMVEGMRQKEQSDLIDRAKGLFMENWLFSADPDLAELEVRGRLLGFDLTAPYTVAILQTASPDPSDCRRAEELTEMQNSLFLRLIQTHIGGGSQNFCAVIRNKIIVLLCRCARDSAFAAISRICDDIQGFYSVPMRGGISDSSKSPLDIRRCYLEAQTASTVAAQSDRRRIVFYDQVSLEFILQSIPPHVRQDLRKMMFSSCTPEEQEEFLQTIRLYFEHDGSIKACAQSVYVHRNTFQYWMDRLKRRTGYDLKIPKDSLLLYLAAQELN